MERGASGEPILTLPKELILCGGLGFIECKLAWG